MDTGYEDMTMEEFHALPFMQRKDPLLIIREAFSERFPGITWREVALAVILLEQVPERFQVGWHSDLLKKMKQLDEWMSYTSLTSSGRYCGKIEQLEEECRQMVFKYITSRLRRSES